MSDGAELFVATYDGGFDRTLVVVHGGPGVGLSEFRHVGEVFAQKVNVVLFDQRGVLHSDALDPENFDFDVLVRDLHDLCKALGLAKWSVLGHSFGGLLAMLYAVRYPEEIEALVLDCPGLHWGESTAFTSAAYAAKLEERGYRDLAVEIAAMTTAQPHEMMAKMPQSIIREVQVPLPIAPKLIREIEQDYAAITPEEHQKTAVHTELVLQYLQEQGDHLSYLRELRVPSLLLIAEKDIVCSPLQRERFLADVPGGEMIVLPYCGHLMHHEIPQLFVDTVLDYVERVCAR